MRPSLLISTAVALAPLWLAACGESDPTAMLAPLSSPDAVEQPVGPVVEADPEGKNAGAATVAPTPAAAAEPTGVPLQERPSNYTDDPADIDFGGFPALTPTPGFWHAGETDAVELEGDCCWIELGTILHDEGKPKTLYYRADSTFDADLQIVGEERSRTWDDRYYHLLYEYVLMPGFIRYDPPEPPPYYLVRQLFSVAGTVIWRLRLDGNATPPDDATAIIHVNQHGELIEWGEWVEWDIIPVPAPTS